MRVCISSNTGDYVTLEVDSQDTIGHIIDQYLLKEKLNKSDLLLLYNSTSLDKNKTLEHYEIEDGSFLQLLYKLNGGGTEVDFKTDGSNTVQQGFSNTAPKYRTVYEGINLEGKCTNPSCIANGKMVIMPMKDQKEIDFVSKNDSFVCPQCHKEVSPITCGFYKCRFYFTGETADDEDEDLIKTVKFEGKTSNGKYLLYKPENSQSNITSNGEIDKDRWYSLIIRCEIDESL